ncbi:zf-HC2 domain-containing protein [Spirillospora sp. NPDC029432]|uniref:anti-sigma factor family protein n=1 Tax=Spirillospora sp. NPDC029432 TaxID=3154599 RepID=UPI0034516437
MNDCGEMRAALGVYVLGAIDPGERSRLEAHLEGCPACRDELAGLAGLPALLGRVTERQIEQMAGPPPELLDSLLARAARRRRFALWRRPPGGGRLWWGPGVLAACALVAVGVLTGALFVSAREGAPVAAPAPSISTSAGAERLRASDPGNKVRAEMILYRKKWGTKVELHLSGAPYGESCRFYAVARDGQRDMLGSWHVAYRRGYGQYAGSTMFQRDQLFSFEIVTLGGQPLLTIPA